MPSVSVVSPSTAIRADAVVVGVSTGPALFAGADPIDAALGGRLLAALTALGATGRPDEVLKIATLGLVGYPLVVATGVGAEPDAEALRFAVGAALRELRSQARVHVAIDGPPGAIAEGALLGAYQFTGYKSESKAVLRTISISGPSSARAATRRATIVAEAVALTRDLVNTPPNDLYPKTFADRAAKLGEGLGLDVEVLDEKALRRGGYGGILGVGAGSVRPPRLVRISYRPSKARAHVALVGKGITFDSGGLNIKTANMAAMKSDMGGAAAVLASVLAAKQLNLPVRVTATVPMAENLLSGSGFRPSDVLRMRNGRTVEVTDTDAEGRLILADAITRAADDGPDRLIEISTLTGAQVNALGMRVMGVMGEPAWRDEVVAAAGAAGESAWAMPVTNDDLPELESPVADLVNLPGERWAGMLVGGRFLSEFVPDGLPWAHLDIAGPSFNPSKARGYTPRGGTGVGARTIISALERLATPPAEV